jgi:two-component system response regulator RegX3
VLVVDDEEMLSENTVEYFEMFEVRTAWVDSAAACLDFLKTNSVDLILLDVNLGETSGFDLCKTLRKTSTVPILFISARTSDDDMLLALNIGGDDYIKKPYSLSILLAKVKAVLKRYKSPTLDVEVFTFGDLRVDFGDSLVYVNEVLVPLKAMEFKLLAYLVKNKNRPIAKHEFFTHVWEDAFSVDNTLNVHLRRLREQVEEDPNEPKLIKTVRGTGYMFEVKS